MKLSLLACFFLIRAAHEVALFCLCIISSRFCCYLILVKDKSGNFFRCAVLGETSLVLLGTLVITALSSLRDALFSHN